LVGYYLSRFWEERQRHKEKKSQVMQRRYQVASLLPAMRGSRMRFPHSPHVAHVRQLKANAQVWKSRIGKDFKRNSYLQKL